MKIVTISALLVIMILVNTASPQVNMTSPRVAERGAVAAIYYWKAKPGKLEEYNRYIREVGVRAASAPTSFFSKQMKESSPPTGLQTGALSSTHLRV